MKGLFEKNNIGLQLFIKLWFLYIEIFLKSYFLFSNHKIRIKLKFIVSAPILIPLSNGFSSKIRFCFAFKIVLSVRQWGRNWFLGFNWGVSKAKNGFGFQKTSFFLFRKDFCLNNLFWFIKFDNFKQKINKNRRSLKITISK